MGECFTNTLCIVLFSCQTSRICVSVRRETSIFPASLPPPPPPIFFGIEPAPRLCCPRLLRTRPAKLVELGGGEARMAEARRMRPRRNGTFPSTLRKTQLCGDFLWKTSSLCTSSFELLILLSRKGGFRILGLPRMGSHKQMRASDSGKRTCNFVLHDLRSHAICLPRNVCSHAL